MKAKLKRFADPSLLFICPICQEKLSLDQNSLLCPSRHSFDLAKVGYINLAPQIKASKEYDKDSFLNRNLILEAGFYDHILEKVEELITDSDLKILDVACGEGFYSRKLSPKIQGDFYAFDLSKDSITLAAKQEEEPKIKWFVGDLAHLPLENRSFDLILDIFSPANYQEFKRVAKKGARLIKVIPHADHLKEIRNLVSEELHNSQSQSHKVTQLFQEQFPQFESYSIQRTLPLSLEQKEAFLKMTPLLFHVDKSKIDWSKLTQVTVAADVLVAQI